MKFGQLSPRSVLEALDGWSEGIVAYDREGRFLAFNEVALQRIGRPEGELVGKCVWTEFPDTRGNPFHRAFERVVATGRGERVELHYDRTGDDYFVELRPLGEDAVLAVWAETTGRARAERRLKQLQRLTTRLAGAQSFEQVSTIFLESRDALLEASAGGLFVADRDCLRRVSCFGHSPELAGAYVTIPFGAPTPISAAFREGRAIWHGTAAEIDREYPHLAAGRAASGDSAWASVPLVHDGKALGVFGLNFEAPHAFTPEDQGFVESIALQYAQALQRLQLLTELQRSVARSKAREEREVAVAEFEKQLLGVVSHDLRNPLSAIVGSATMIAKDPAVTERMALQAARVLRCSKRMEAIITDLLDFTRARLGSGIRLHRTETEAHRLVIQVVSDLEVALPGRKVDVSVSGTGSGFWDAGRLGQVISNLVVNALKHSGDDRRVRVRSEYTPTHWRFITHNRGTPIDSDQLPRIFDAHTRGTNTPDGEGLGLGLFIVRHLVDAHGGVVTVSSDARTGTTFEVRLPRN